MGGTVSGNAELRGSSSQDTNPREVRGAWSQANNDVSTASPGLRGSQDHRPPRGAGRKDSLKDFLQSASSPLIAGAETTLSSLLSPGSYPSDLFHHNYHSSFYLNSPPSSSTATTTSSRSSPSLTSSSDQPFPLPPEVSAELQQVNNYFSSTGATGRDDNRPRPLSGGVAYSAAAAVTSRPTDVPLASSCSRQDSSAVEETSLTRLLASGEEPSQDLLSLFDEDPLFAEEPEASDSGVSSLGHHHKATSGGSAIITSGSSENSSPCETTTPPLLPPSSSAAAQATPLFSPKPHFSYPPSHKMEREEEVETEELLDPIPEPFPSLSHPGEYMVQSPELRPPRPPRPHQGLELHPKVEVYQVRGCGHFSWPHL